MTLLPIDGKKFHLLTSCMENLSSPNGMAVGMCFHLSTALLLDIRHGELCIGTLRGATPEEAMTIPNASLEPFLHCWVEVNDDVLAPTTIERFGGIAPIPRDYYYRANGIHNVHRMSRRTIKGLAMEQGWYRYFTTGKYPVTGRPLGDILLDECGVRWQLSSAGGVIPLTE